MQNYPPPGGAPNYSPSGMPQGGQAPKKSKAPLIIGGVIGCLALIVIIVLALGGLAYFGIKKAEETAKNLNANITRNTNGGSASSGERAPGTERFTNTRTGRDGNLSKYYVDFSFDYPNTWKLDPDPNPSYVRVERMTDEDVTTENFSVGWFGATRDARGNKALLSDVVNKLATQVSGNFPGFEKVSEGETTVGTYDGYELRFRRNPSEMGAGQLAYWGRIIVLVTDADPKRGVSLILLATEKADGVSGIDDVGVAGELSGILNSFRLGSDASQ